MVVATSMCPNATVMKVVCQVRKLGEHEERSTPSPRWAILRPTVQSLSLGLFHRSFHRRQRGVGCQGHLHLPHTCNPSRHLMPGHFRSLALIQSLGWVRIVNCVLLDGHLWYIHRHGLGCVVLGSPEHRTRTEAVPHTQTTKSCAYVVHLHVLSAPCDCSVQIRSQSKVSVHRIFYSDPVDYTIPDMSLPGVKASWTPCTLS